jgi:hypothetical protein
MNWANATQKPTDEGEMSGVPKAITDAAYSSGWGQTGWNEARERRVKTQTSVLTRGLCITMGQQPCLT